MAGLCQLAPAEGLLASLALLLSSLVNLVTFLMKELYGWSLAMVSISSHIIKSKNKKIKSLIIFIGNQGWLIIELCTREACKSNPENSCNPMFIFSTKEQDFRISGWQGYQECDCSRAESEERFFLPREYIGPLFGVPGHGDSTWARG